MKIRETSDKSVRYSEIYTYAPGEWAKENLLYLEESGHKICNNRYFMNRMGTEGYLLLFTLAGEGMIITGQGQFACREGDMALVACGDPHALFARNDWEFLWIRFCGNKSRELADTVFEHYGSRVGLPNTALSSRFFRQMVQEHGEDWSVSEDVMISARIQYILSEMISYAAQEEKIRGKDFLNHAFDYIEQNYMRQIAIQEIAGELNISKSSLSHMFKKETGFSPYEFVVNLRLNRAKELLRDTEMSIGEISALVGFNSEANFIRCFHEKNRMTPNAFRRQKASPSDFIDVYFGKRLYKAR